jgi:6-phosphogluconate dehydrogenase
MQLGMVGLGRMGSNMTLRLLKGGHQVVVYDRSPDAVRSSVASGAVACGSLEEMGEKLRAPRAIWLMIPAGPPIDDTIQRLSGIVSPGDVIIDGGNSNFKDSRRRAEELRTQQLEFLDAGVSGGVWGLKIGFCLMIGGSETVFAQLEPIFKTLAPKDGYAYVGPAGAGHYAKMVHNGVEYGMMEAYAEGFEILHAAPYRFDLRQLAQLWNQGSVVRSWLLELAQAAFERDPGLDRLRGYVEDTGEGRWTVTESIDHAVPAPALALSLYMRFRSRQDDSFAAKVLAALRNEFGGHAVKPE